MSTEEGGATMQRIHSSPKGFSDTLPGRLDRLWGAARRTLRRVGGGSVALAIGAVAAAALLATTLVFPETVSRVLSIVPDGGFPQRQRPRAVAEEPIRVAPTQGQRNELPAGHSRVSRATAGTPVATQVLGKLVTEKKAAGGKSGVTKNQAGAGGTESSGSGTGSQPAGAPVVANSDEWTGSSGSQSGTTPSSGSGSDGEWTGGSGGTTVQPSSAPPPDEGEWSS